MSFVREMRERQVAPAPAERSGALGTIVIAVVAFAIGAGGIVAWKWMPTRNPQPVAAKAAPPAETPKFAGNRVGRAAAAPLLRTCTKSDTFEGFGKGDPEAIYTLLTTVGTMQRLAPLVGAEMGDGAQLVEYWREIADCVYQQNSWHLCDADNRALAVESASAFIRGATRIAENPPKGRGADIVLRDNARARERVLDALRARLRNGQLVAADFGPIQPPAVKALLSEVKPAGNACAKP
jgi:hypothetical protein